MCRYFCDEFVLLADPNMDGLFLEGPLNLVIYNFYDMEIWTRMLVRRSVMESDY